jgi:Site-specific recombinases, DNA invertase Pin homologs
MEYSFEEMSAMLAGTYRAAIYCRLSKDDELQGESASIANQREMLENYCKQQGWEVVAVYQDDGYTGLNTDRPDLKRLLKAVEKKVINLVVTKDLSRLSRNYLDAGRLIEDFFPRHGVRYVAVNDSVDTLRDNNEIAPFKNVLNEMYSKDISKKVHSSYLLKATKGQFTGCLAPFGYQKDPGDKNHLIIDPETAPIVKKIFEYARNGHGPNWIRRQLEVDQVACPTWWNRQRGLRDHYTKWELDDPENGRFIWDFTVIKDLLINPVYTGAIASQKKLYKFKIGTIAERKPEDWIVVEGMHEALVDQDTFDIVQEKLRSRQRPRDDGNYSLFAGLIKCGECRKALTIRKTNAKHPQMIYSCKTYNAFGKHHCTQHRIEFDKLYKLVIDEIRQLARKALADRDGAAEQLAENCSAEQRAQSESLARQIMKNKERLEILEKMISRLYEDMISGKISEANFEVMIKKAQDEQAEVRKAIEQDQELLKQSMQSTENARKWLEMVQDYVQIDELTPEILHRLIKEIVVHEAIDPDGHRNISIEIHYNLRPIEGHREL